VAEKNANIEKADSPRLGARIRALRRRNGLSQAQLASELGISPSYLNLIESNRRPLTAPLLIKLARHFGLELHELAPEEDARLVSELMEVFADPVLEGHGLTSTDVREVAQQNPAFSRAVLALYQSYESQRETSEAVAMRVAQGEEGAIGTGSGADLGLSRLPSEEVSDLIQQHMNYFPELEVAAEQLWKKANLVATERFAGLSRYLAKSFGVEVRIVRWDTDGVLRRYDPSQKTLALSELLPTRSRAFQLAHQISLLAHHDLLDRLTQSPLLTSGEARSLARVTLANYFAAAVLMPYVPFLNAAREVRYDIDVIGRRFRVGFEQVCHRLTSLRRPGAEGIPLHMLRIDVAGNISKRFSASGIRFARFSGACPRWNVFQAFMTPGLIRIQLSRMPDGTAYFCIARTIQKDSGGFHAQQPVQAIALGCKVAHAREMVYSDGIDVDNLDVATPVGVTCRLCERTDCEQRAFPSIRHPLQVDENVRAVSLYSPASGLRVL
jgi:predicted transcriptional regulator/transcriptional regulator with XRE-family HTH domain